MEIHQVKIAELKPAEYNPRKLTKDQHAQLTESIKKFGLVDPIIANKHKGRENVVVGGHQRLKIAREQGFEAVPVTYVDLDENQEKELNLRLNKNLGEWDWDQLANNFDIDFLKETGFTNNELGFMQGEAEEDIFDADAEAAKIQTPDSKPGEVYELGPHRLMCGSSTELADVEKLMGGEKAALVFTDPPYGVNYVSGASKGMETEKHSKIINDDLSGSGLEDFLTKCFINAFAVSKTEAPIYSWFATSTYREFRTALEKAGWRYSQVIIWIKQRFVLSHSEYHHCYEPCMFGWKKDEKHYTNSKIRNVADVQALDVEQFSDMLDVWFERRDNTQTYVHPTQKPIRLAGRALRKSSEPGAAVLDLFGGSGSTLMACEQLGRRAFSMELDPKYCDVIRKRYEQYVARGTAGA